MSLSATVKQKKKPDKLHESKVTSQEEEDDNEARRGAGEKLVTNT